MIKLLILFPLLMLLNTTSAQDRALDQLREKLEAGEVLLGEIDHTFEDQYTGNVEEHSGKIWIGKDRYKIDVGTQQVLVIDDVSRVYNESENRLIISQYEPEEDDFAPSRLLNLSDDVFTMDERRENGSYFIKLESDDPFEELKLVDIELDDNLVPVSIKAEDQTGNTYSTIFREARFEVLEEDVITIDYPDDAEIVDMRE